ncbi:MAG: trypsin-like peptidase domain-containing protein [Chloroflexota bacterium]
MNALADIGTAVIEVGDRVAASTVGIGNRWRGGSGVVIGKNQVLTSAHNLHGEEPEVYFADGREARAQVKGVDQDADLAVLEVDTADAPAITWGDGAELQMGTPVIALANPSGGGRRLTVGFISNLDQAFRGPRGREVGQLIEHTARLMPGSSGGPIVDAEGRVLGINTIRMGGGFYGAIAADAAFQERIERIGRGEIRSHRRIGIGIAPPFVARRLRRAVGLPARDGLLVRDVEDESPAATAGILEGDLIVDVGGRPIREVNDMFEAIESAAEGSVSLTLVRGIEERTVEVTPTA